MKTLLVTRHSIDSETHIDYEVSTGKKTLLLEENVDLDLNDDISSLTVHADKLDYYYAVASGVLTGLLDVFFVGDWDFVTAKKDANITANNIVMNFAKKDPKYIKEYCSKYNKDPNRLETAIHYLEKKYKLPGDNDYTKLDKKTSSPGVHHLDDLCHHPTLVGLACSIIVQFSGEAIYVDKNSELKKIPIAVNKYNQFVGSNPVSKLFAGIINWFYNVAQIVANTQGHWISDMAGSSTSASKGNDGSGLPGPILSLLKELSALPVIKSNKMGKQLRKAFQNGIGKRDCQVDLYIFNGLFQGASSKLDFRTEMAIQTEINRQSVPVVLNDVIVRAIYFIRRFIQEYKQEESIKKMDLSKIMPFQNHTIARMLTVATGTFVVVDIADAAIRAAIKTGKSKSTAALLSQMVLRVNFPGIGRFIIAVNYDALLSVKRRKLERKKQEISTLYTLNNTNMQFQVDNEWIALNTIDTYADIREIAKNEVCEYIEASKADSGSLSHAESIFFSTDIPSKTINQKRETKSATVAKKQEPTLVAKHSYRPPYIFSIINVINKIISLVICGLISLYAVKELKNYNLADMKLNLISIGLIFSTIMIPVLIDEYSGIFFYAKILFYLIYPASMVSAIHCACKYLYQANRFKISLWIPIVCFVVWLITYFIYWAIRDDHHINKLIDIVVRVLLAPIRYATIASLSIFVFRFFAWLFSAMDNPFKGASFCAMVACAVFVIFDITSGELLSEQ